MNTVRQSKGRRRSLWIGIDGIDGTGKTTSIEVLRSDPEIVGTMSCKFFDEFTFTPVGNLIKDIISEHRFFSLSQPPTTRLADAWLILADWTLKLETSNCSTFDVFFSDRSHLSAIGYQITRVEDQYGSETAAQLFQLFRSVSEIVRRSIEGITFEDVLLTITEDGLRRRITNRGELALKSQQIDFLMNAQRLMLQLRPNTVIDVSDITILELTQKIKQRCYDLGLAGPNSE
jgi:thymidylate kinase